MSKGIAVILGLAALGGGLYYILRPKAKTGVTVTVDIAVGIQDVIFQGTTRLIKGAFVGLEDKISAVWWWDETAQAWRGYSPSAPDWANDLLNLTQGYTYSINASVACQWTYTI